MKGHDMLIVNSLLMILAFVFLLMGALSAPPSGRIQWGWLGMTLWALAVLLGTSGGLIKG